MDGTLRWCRRSGQEPDGGCSSDRIRPQFCPESSGPHSEDPRTFLHSELQVQAACALLPLQEYARGTGGESTSVFSCFGSFSPLTSVSPVLCLESELRPLVHFDGELLMVIFVVSYLQ